ncbi:MAG: GNAT family N-acetyltransferase [Myxococcota bacterium]|nr:GNAT family N-acetyltransferase [Myxococcota bacterium]
MYLNTSGEDETHSPCIEFNTLLCDPGRESSIACALRGFLDDLQTSEPWDELAAPGFVDGPALTAMQNSFRALAVSDRAKPSYYIDLNELRDNNRDYPDTLTSKERTHFRQSVRKLSDRGELSLENATTTHEALGFLEELSVLHQKSWTSRGRPGSFASVIFSHFHRRLIARCSVRGEAQLLRLRAADRTIGVVYNFVFRGKLYFYQCGYDYSLGKRVSPGVVVQGFAVRYATTIGLAEYDLMAGDAEYKTKLATQFRKLHWLVWQAPGIRMRALDLLRRTKRKLANHSLAKHSFVDACRALVSRNV